MEEGVMYDNKSLLLAEAREWLIAFESELVASGWTDDAFRVSKLNLLIEQELFNETPSLL